MSENNASQAQHVADFFKRSIDETMSRMEGGFEEMAKLETLAAEQTRVALTDFARMSQEGLSYATRLSTEWRKLSLDAFRRGAELFIPRG